MSDYWFYLSYARNDPIGNQFVKVFHKDLSETIHSLTELDQNIKVQDIGFCYGGEQEREEEWPDSVKEPLLTSRVFVPLFSPSYFANDYCGKELQGFLTRWNIKQYQTSQGASWPPVVMPVLWKPIPPDQITTVIHGPKDTRYSLRDFDSVYAEQGLYQLIKVQAYERHYTRFLKEFAKLVVANANSGLRSGDHLPPLAELSSAFPIQEPERKGPKVAHFVYVAGRQDELSSLRKDTRSYGNSGGPDWKPFYPPVPEWIGIIVSKLATEESFFPDKLDLDESFIERLKEAQQDNAIVILIVDSWTLRLDDYNARMREYDQKTDFYNCAVLVPLNDQDQETSSNQVDLEKVLKYTFSSKASKDPASFRFFISSIGDLKKELHNALHKVRGKVQQVGNLAKDAEGLIVRPRPQVDPKIGYQ